VIRWVHGLRLLAVCSLVLSMAPGVSAGQESSEAPATVETPATIDDSPQEAGDDDNAPPRRRLTKWNEYDGPISTFRFGFGLLVDFATYIQDDENEQQVGDLDEDVGLRDARLLFSGRFKTKRPLSWTIGYMYDSADDEWRFRQTGIQIGVPELLGNLFIGRTKEGYSMIKVMTGYHPWTMERSPGLDAFVPILADGAKWMGYLPGPRVFYSLGMFGDEVSEDEKFATYDYQGVTRLGWLPIASEEEKTIWHVAAMGRYGRPDEGSILFRSRPEESLAPFFVETPEITSDFAGTTGFETYYRRGSWLFGGEYDWQNVAPKAGGDRNFHAGDVVAAWIATGETRGYKPRGGYFDPVSPTRTVFQGGPGAWEAVLHMSYIDLDDRNIQGGKLWRLTPMMNWYLSDNVRLEFGYGYSILDRFGVTGHTHFFQSRVQLTL
jgi:phosphate-selective porin OprO/OprP